MSRIPSRSLAKGEAWKEMAEGEKGNRGRKENSLLGEGGGLKGDVVCAKGKRRPCTWAGRVSRRAEAGSAGSGGIKITIKI